MTVSVCAPNSFCVARSRLLLLRRLLVRLLPIDRDMRL